MKELPKNPPVNPAAEHAHKLGHTAPDLESAIDDETGGRVHPSQEELRSDKEPELPLRRDDL